MPEISDPRLLQLYISGSTSHKSATKVAASDTKSAYAQGRLRQRGLRFPTRVGGFCNISGGFNR